MRERHCGTQEMIDIQRSRRQRNGRDDVPQQRETIVIQLRQTLTEDIAIGQKDDLIHEHGRGDDIMSNHSPALMYPRLRPYQ